MNFTFSDSLTSKQLLISREDLIFFQKIKNSNIQLDLKFNSNISEDVLKNKKIDEVCPDITKLGNIKNDLINSQTNLINIKKIIIELE